MKRLLVAREVELLDVCLTPGDTLYRLRRAFLRIKVTTQLFSSER